MSGTKLLRFHESKFKRSRHATRKWGKLAGPANYSHDPKEAWQCQIAHTTAEEEFADDI